MDKLEYYEEIESDYEFLKKALSYIFSSSKYLLYKIQNYCSILIQNLTNILNYNVGIQNFRFLSKFKF